MDFKRTIILKPLQEGLSRPVHFLQILVGPRQVGKTTAVQQLLAEWPSPSIYLTGDQLTPPTTGLIAEGWEKARLLKGAKPLLVVDEIQKVPHWSEVVKKLHDEDVRKKRPLRVILLGSSALLIQRGLSESLAGRFQLIRCPHWSYSECRDAFRLSLDQFLFYGGYPGAIPLVDDFTAWRDYVQNSLLETVIGRDIPALQRIDNPALFRQTLHLACHHPAEIISLQKLVGQLQDKGSLNTVANYLDLLAATFLIHSLRKWSARELRVRNSSPKLIVRNNALINALRNVPFSEARADTAFWGRLVENAVGAALVDGGEDAYYWNDRDKEVDFVVKRGTQLLALEVKSGAAGRHSGLKIFQSRNDRVKTLQIGGDDSDLTLEQFFQEGVS